MGESAGKISIRGFISAVIGFVNFVKEPWFNIRFRVSKSVRE